ncbi:MAG: serine hydrolase, partial [Lachnospiraceae bacterium]|nr:serine hydrolase [Lachnospiraceae bacterium]
MNREEFYRHISESKGNESNICQICVIRDGQTLYEESWRGFKKDDPVNVNSVTKGVMAILAGIAFDKGYLRSVDDKVMDFFPDYTVKRGEKTIYDVTIKHLLTMTAPYKGKS